MPQMMLHIDADGMMSFFSTRYDRNWMTISSDALQGYNLATDVEPLIQQLGLDPNGDAQNWWQDASFAHLEFLSTEGGRGYGVLDEMNFSVTRGVPAPGALALLGLGGLAAGRRRR
jgi:MYXO-CTERM domain-containing protein